MDEKDFIIKMREGEGNAKVTVVDRGVIHHKTVEVSEIIGNLTKSHKISTGILPRNTRFFSGTKTNYRIGIETLPRVRDFGLFSRVAADENKKQKVMKIPFPPCLFVFEVQADKLYNTYVYALSQRISTENETLYHFPFGNTHSDGRVCWGTAHPPPIKVPMNLISVVSVFFDSAFNGDLVSSVSWKQNGTKTPDFWSLIKFLDGKESFPQNMLNSTSKTLKGIMYNE